MAGATCDLRGSVGRRPFAERFEDPLVGRLLGHRNIQTTINFYCGLATTQANEAYGKIIREHVKFDDEASL